ASLLFLQRYVEHNLLMYEYEGVQDLGKGPIIALIDMSSSMAKEIGGGDKIGLSNASITRSTYAVGIALALCLLANKDKRDIYIGFFNSMMAKQFTFKKGVYTPDDIIALSRVSHSGGTNY